MSDPIDEIRARWSDARHCLREQDERDVQALLWRIRALEKEVGFYEVERFALARIEGAEPLPVVHTQALLTFYEESYAEGFVIAKTQAVHELNELRSAHQAALEALRREINELRSEHQVELNALRRERDGELARHRGGIAEACALARRALLIAVGSTAELEQQRSAHRQRVAELEQERDDWRAQEHQQRDNYNVMLEDQVTLRKAHQAALEALRKEHAHELHQACLEARDDVTEALAREREGF